MKADIIDLVNRMKKWKFIVEGSEGIAIDGAV